MDYFDSSVRTHAYTSFQVLGENDGVLGNHNNAACFAAISAYTIPKTAKKVIFIREKSSSPYKEREVKRWADDLNEIGFLSKLIIEPDRYLFEVDMSKYEYKEHLMSTLFLLRALFESGFNRVPEYYFQAMDKAPDSDKFIVIQRAHKKINMSGHMITGKDNGPDITKNTLFSRWKHSNKSVYYGKSSDYHRISYSDKWNGKPMPGDPDGPMIQLKCNECDYGH